MTHNKVILFQLAVFHFFFKKSKLRQVFKLKKMIEKRFVEHDTSVEDYVGKSRKQEHERENDTKCEIAGNVFGKRKARRGRIAKHRAR